MTVYAETHGTTLVQYPYGLAQLQAENPYTNYGPSPDFVAIFPETNTAVASGYVLSPVTIAAQSPFNPLTQVCSQDAAPSSIGGVWMLGWNVSAMSAAQQQQAAVQAAQAAYAQAIAAGLAITSTGTPAISGTYGVDTVAQNNIASIVTGFVAGQGLPGGGQTFVYLDLTDTPHVFTQAQFLAVATAIRNYVYAVDLAAQGQGSWPAASVTIA